MKFCNSKLQHAPPYKKSITTTRPRLTCFPAEEHALCLCHFLQEKASTWVGLKGQAYLFLRIFFHKKINVTGCSSEVSASQRSGQATASQWDTCPWPLCWNLWESLSRDYTPGYRVWTNPWPSWCCSFFVPFLFICFCWERNVAAWKAFCSRQRLWHFL